MDPIKLAGVAGLEPTHTGVKVLCLTDLATPQVVDKNLGWVTGLEPANNGATIRRVNRFTIPTTL